MQSILKGVLAASLLSLASGGAFAAEAGGGGQVGGGQGQKKAAKMADQAGPQGGPQGGGQMKMQKKDAQMDKPPTPGGPGTAHKKMDAKGKSQGVVSPVPPPEKGHMKGGAMKDQAGPQTGPQGGSPKGGMHKSGKMMDQGGPQGGQAGGGGVPPRGGMDAAKAGIK